MLPRIKSSSLTKYDAGVSISHYIAYMGIFAVFVGIAIEGLLYNMMPVNYLLTLYLNVLLINKTKHNYFMLIPIFLLFYCNYSIIYPNFINKLDTMFTQPITIDVTHQSINILFLFNSFLFIIFPTNIPKTIFLKKYLTSNRIIPIPVFIILIVVLSVIMLTGISAPTSEGERSDPSAIYEYSICLFIIGFYFTKSRKGLYILATIALIMALRNFAYGGRIAGVQFLICLYLFMFAHKTSLFKLIVYSLPIFFGLYVVGAVRGALLSGYFSIDKIITHIMEGGFALDTAYSAYYTSEVFVYMSDKINNQLYLLFAFISATIVGYAAFPDALLQDIADKFITNYHGGIYPYYFWFYLGVIGVFIGTIIVKLYFTSIKKLTLPNASGLTKCLAIYFICHIFRWYLYTPYSLLRGSLILSILYLLIYSVSYYPHSNSTHENTATD